MLKVLASVFQRIREVETELGADNMIILRIKISLMASNLALNASVTGPVATSDCDYGVSLNRLSSILSDIHQAEIEAICGENLPQAAIIQNRKTNQKP